MKWDITSNGSLDAILNHLYKLNVGELAKLRRRRYQESKRDGGYKNWANRRGGVNAPVIARGSFMCDSN